MSRSEFNRQSQIMQDLLEFESNRIGRETGFVERRSKVSAALFVKMLVLGLLEKGDASLNQLVQVGEDLGVCVSESGLAQRMTEAASRLLQQLFQTLLAQQQTQAGLEPKLLSGFAGVHILDSTQISLPERMREMFGGSGGSASVAGAKLQVSYEYLSGQLQAIELTRGTLSDQASGLVLTMAQAGSLSLFDLGYFKQSTLVGLAQAGAFFLSRLNTQTHLYRQANDPTPLDLLAYMRRQTADCGEVALCLGESARLRLRLVFQTLPPEQVAERRRRARRAAQKKGRTCSQRHLALLAWNFFITNVPAARWTPPQVVLVYRLRWQIELLFKLWKSEAKFDTVRCQRPERFVCLLYARLLGLLLFHGLIAPYRTLGPAELSLTKAFHVFQRALPALLALLAGRGACLDGLLARLTDKLQRFALCSTRLKSPSTRQRLSVGGVQCA